MMKKITLLILSSSLLLAETPNSEKNQLSSTQASYDGNALILEGRVELDHGLGNMCADQAFLQKQETGKDFPFSLIQLKKGVLLSLKNKSELKCSLAELDFNDLRGTLSSEGNDKVSYKDFLKKEGNTLVPFYLVSQLIDLQFSKKETPKEATQYEVQSLLAKKSVQIEYANEFVLNADEASYHNTGILQAYATSNNSKCNLTYQGEKLEADRIRINIKSSLIQLLRPTGSIPSQMFSQELANPLSFQCDNLSWDHEKEILTLKNQVLVEEKILGTLFAKNEMIIEQGTYQKKKSIKSISIEGFSRLEHEDPKTNWRHAVSCFGSLHVDGLKGLVTLTSPAQKEKQICYQDLEIILHSNKALIEYDGTAGFKPLSLALQGDVTIESAALDEPSRQGIADRLTYSPETQTVILSALPKKRVLFKDEEQNLSMSAQEIHLTKDPNTGKMQAKGIGNVKFSLSGEENELLKKRFSLKSKES
jgi:hypothetical protein